MDIKVKPQSIKTKVGRPTKYSQELADELCAELAEGKSLRTVCLDNDMPSKQTVFRWLRTNENFCDQYARAKVEAVNAWTDEILDIADDGTNDWMTIEVNGVKKRVIDHEAIQRSRLRIDTRKWIASKLVPKKYGNKLDVVSNDQKLEGLVVFKHSSDPLPSKR